MGYIGDLFFRSSQGSGLASNARNYHSILQTEMSSGRITLQYLNSVLGPEAEGSGLRIEQKSGLTSETPGRI